MRATQQTAIAPGTGATTLVGEHTDILREVHRRAAAVSARAERHNWPHAELAALLGFLRTTLLRQASDEEAHLFPADASSAPAAELSADHGRLYAVTEQLERAYRDGCPTAQLQQLLDQLVTTLRRHVAAEERILPTLAGTGGELPAAATAGNYGPPEDAAVVIDLDALPEDVAVQMCIERLLRLRPGQRARIRSCAPAHLNEICEWLHDFDPIRFGFNRTSGDAGTQLEVSCRTAA
ncbi:MAG TPA: hemerythrin domain-containing protein [Jatrophihabitans sp.]|nr:hemerythrin domain-containing protein [Jatrophihabitans sp.]